MKLFMCFGDRPKTVIFDLTGLIFFDPFEPCFSPEVKTGPVTIAEFGPIAHDSFEYHCIRHFSRIAIGLKQYVLNALEDSVSFATILPHACHP